MDQKMSREEQQVLADAAATVDAEQGRIDEEARTHEAGRRAVMSVAPVTARQADLILEHVGQTQKLAATAAGIPVGFYMETLSPTERAISLGISIGCIVQHDMEHGHDPETGDFTGKGKY